MTENIDVAVIGLGPSGLVTLKNLKEEGFNVTGFDRNDYVGGLWQYTTEDQTSVMETTVVNISKERGCFTDYPYPEDMSSYPTAPQVQEYLVNYTKHFDLEPNLKLKTSIKSITFDEDRQKWILEIEGSDQKAFDKVVLAGGGMVGAPSIPTIEGMEKFEGTIVHSRAFKRPKDYAGKRVMVVGFGNSAADTSTQLVGIADKVYLSHRHGARVLPRGFKGAPIDHTHSWRIFSFQCALLRYFPRFGEKFFDKFIKSLQDKSFKIRPEWGFEPAAKIPIVSDNLVPCLEAGTITSVRGLKRVLSGNEVELEDGNIVEVDAIVWCTGYKSDFGVLDPRFDPSATSSPWSSASGLNGKSMFYLYHNIFSLEKPDSLAFMGHIHFPLAGFPLFDMASTAIAQVWAGKSALPPKPEMRLAIEKHHEWLGKNAERGFNLSPGSVDAETWMRAIDDINGAGVYQYLGYGWKGWWFWLRDRKFCNLLMGGIWSPHIHRVFEGGKRKAWDGARETLERVNAAVAETKRLAKEKKA